MLLPHQNFAPVSAVIPCFRCVGTIERAVRSVLTQTLLPREVLLIDDASDDGTWELLKSLEKHYPGWIKIFRIEHNVGPASARNFGWNRVTQQYIAFLDSDDSWHSEKINFQYGYMRLHPDVGLSGHSYIWGPDDVRPVSVGGTVSVTVISAKKLILKSYFPTPSVMVKSDLPLRFRAGQRYSEDVFLWQELAFMGVKIVRLNCPLAMLHKAPYGASGLSGQLLAMECAEINNFFVHYQNKKIGILLFALAIAYSLLKFLRRLLITAFR